MDRAARFGVAPGGRWPDLIVPLDPHLRVPVADLFLSTVLIAPGRGFDRFGPNTFGRGDRPPLVGDRGPGGDAEERAGPRVGFAVDLTVLSNRVTVAIGAHTGGAVVVVVPSGREGHVIIGPFEPELGRWHDVVRRRLGTARIRAAVVWAFFREHALQRLLATARLVVGAHRVHGFLALDRGRPAFFLGLSADNLV